MEIIRRIASIANELDTIGYHQEADYMTKLMQKMAATQNRRKVVGGGSDDAPILRRPSPHEMESLVRQFEEATRIGDKDTSHALFNIISQFKHIDMDEYQINEYQSPDVEYEHYYDKTADPDRLYGAPQ